MSMVLNILKSYAIFILVVMMQILQNTFIRFRSVVCDKALCIVFGKKYTKANFILFYIFYNKLILASYIYYIKIIRLHEKDKIEATFNLLIICR